MRTLATLFLLGVAFPGLSQEGWDKIKVGDHVDVILRNGNNLRGVVTLPPQLTPLELSTGVPKTPKDGPKDFDFSKEEFLSLDVSVSIPALGPGATLSLQRHSIHVVRVLEPLSPEQLAEIDAAIRREQDRIDREEAERQAGQAELFTRLAEEASKLEKERDLLHEAQEDETIDAEIQKLLNIYAKFPPPEWGQDRIEKINKRQLAGEKITKSEREFLTVHEEWIKAKLYLEDLKKKTEEAQNSFDTLLPQPEEGAPKK